MKSESISHIVDAADGSAITVLKPIIDTIVITLCGDAAFKSVPKSALADAEPLALKYWVGFFECVLKAADDPDEWRVTPIRRLKGYKLSVAIRFSKSGPTVQLSTNPVSSKTPPVRLEFSPIQLGPDGIKALAEVWEIFDFDNFPLPSLMADAKVTRLDVAVDVLNIGTYELFVYNPKVWLVWQAGWIVDGIQSFIYHQISGHTKSPMVSPKKRGNLMVYDKREEQKAKKINPVHGDTRHIRIESSQKKNMQLRNMEKVKYPFDKWDIRRAASPKSPFDWKTWHLFLDSVRIRGISEANKLLPEGVWKEVEVGDLEQFPRDIISEELTWKDVPEMLHRSHLSQLIAWAKTSPETFHTYGPDTVI